MLSEAIKFWDSISGKVRELIRSETQNAMRLERYDVTTAPNGTVMGVTKPFGNNEIFLPYSAEVAGAAVGNPVLVAWWGSMSNAKVYYFANGYNGGLAAYPVGSYYWSSVNVSPAVLFGGRWEQVTNRFLFAAGGSYAVGATGGEYTHTLAADEMPAHRHSIAYYQTSGPLAAGQALTRHGTSDKRNGSSDLSGYTGGQNSSFTSGGATKAHNTMPPYLVAYCWHRIG